MISRLSPYLLLPLLFVIASGQTPTSSSPELAKLQNDFAMRYLEPEPHFALTRYYLEHGNRDEAFFTLETARRSILEEAVFDRAFQVVFEGFDNSKAGEEKLLAELARTPDSPDVQFKLADIYISRSDWPRANEILRAAIITHPKDFRFTKGLAGMLSIQGKDAEARRITDDYAKRYPDSREGYTLRIGALAETNPAAAKRLVEESIAKYPEAGEFVFHLGAFFLQQAGELDKAESAFVKAASLAPTSVYIQSWVGRFFFKVRNDGARALPYYLNAYFLSPHAYETEFVESRIRNIYFAQAEIGFQNQIKTGKPLIEILNDQNAGVVFRALEQLDKEWKPAYVMTVAALMGHENGGVRWVATQLLKKKVDSSFDAKLKELLTDSDLRKRGLAAYIAVYRWKNASFGIMDNLLAEKAQLLRFDALSALILEGGVAGKKHAIAHSAREVHPLLRKLLQSAREK